MVATVKQINMAIISQLPIFIFLCVCVARIAAIYSTKISNALSPTTQCKLYI